MQQHKPYQSKNHPAAPRPWTPDSSSSRAKWVGRRAPGTALSQAGQQRRRRRRRRRRLGHWQALANPTSAAAFTASPAGTMAAAAAAASDLPAFDEDEPQAYYLGEGWDEMDPLSDAVLVAAGVALPVHSQVRAASSSGRPSSLPACTCRLPTCHSSSHAVVHAGAQHAVQRAARLVCGVSWDEQLLCRWAREVQAQDCWRGEQRLQGQLSFCSEH